MKKVALLLMIVISMTQVHAQTVDEWLRQRATQRRYLLEQIAALKIYTGYLEKGYAIIQDGLDLIGDIKDGDFNLHAGYFKSLDDVHPAIRDYKRTSATRHVLENVLYRSRFTKRRANAAVIPAGERDYIAGVLSRLLKDREAILNDLETVTMPGQLQLSDEARLRRIDELYEAAQSCWVFAKTFDAEIAALAAQRQHEQKDINNSRALHGLK